jgi:hypothetical protein
VSIVTDNGLDDRAIEIRSPAEAKDFPLASVFRPALRPTQPPVQWVPRVLSLGQIPTGGPFPGQIPTGGPFPGANPERGVTLTTHPHLVPRPIKSRSSTSSPPKRHHGVTVVVMQHVFEVTGK